MRKLAGISAVSLIISFIICGLFGATVGAGKHLQGEKVETSVVDNRIASLSQDFVSIKHNSDIDIVEIGAKINDINVAIEIINKYQYSSNQEFVVSPDNLYYASYEGLVYTKNYEKLVLSPKTEKDYVFHENLKIIGSNAISLIEMEDALVVPWGVTTIEEDAFNGSGTVVLPETITTVEQPQNTAYWYEYLFPKCKDMICSAFVRDNRSLWMLNYDDHWYDYYDLHINEWKTLNGKRYYFVESEGWFHSAPHSDEVEPHMVTGWLNIDGTDYYFEDTGVLVEDCWKKIDGKWTRFDEDGGVKKGFWISIAAWFRGLWS